MDKSEVTILLMMYLKACVPNKIEDLNIYVFNTITEKDESNILTKFIS